MADQQPMSQDDIDALLAQMQGKAAPSPAPAPAAAPEPPAAAAPLVDQDEIDRVVAAAPAPAGTDPQPAPAPPAPVLDQSDIDSLLSSLGVAGDQGASGSGSSAARQAPAAAAAGAPAAGPLDQADIDAIIDHLQAAPPAAAAPAAAAPDPSAAAGPVIGQDAIDDLVQRLTGQAEAPAPPPAPAAAPAATGSGAFPTGRLDQDNIDTLLAQLGANTEGRMPAGEGAAPGTPVPGGTTAMPGTAAPSQSLSRRTLALSNEDLNALVAKHGAGEVAASETMIAQADIDALVQQLATTTGDPEPAKEAVTRALAKHDQAIDRLLADHGEVAKGATDAVVVEKPPAPAGAAPAPPLPMPAGAMAMAPAELRGARWLLAAAVFLLAVCAATLVTVISAIHRLTGELQGERVAQLAPGGDFAEDFKLANARLAERDDEQQDRGVRLLERLRLLHPGHEAEIALVLARHHRRQEAWRRAAGEYAALLDGSAALADDPRIYLEYAEVLDRSGDRPAALRQIYLLLANEAAWTGPVDLHRLPRPAREAAANREAMEEASLLLGRLLGEAAPAGPAMARAEPAHAPAAAHGGGH